MKLCENCVRVCVKILEMILRFKGLHGGKNYSLTIASFLIDQMDRH